MTAVHVVVPGGVDDPSRPSGGNVYDRRVCDGLVARGWSVLERAVPGAWPREDAAARARLAAALRQVPDGGVALVDGLIACGAPEVLTPEAVRLRLVVLVHMPLGATADERDPLPAERERAALGASSAVITTSRWTRQWLLDHYALPQDRVFVAEPGVEPSDPAPGTPAGTELLCVAAVTPAKGQDTLLAALAEVRHLPWRCRLVGATDLDAGFVARLRRQLERTGLGDRVRLVGPRHGIELHREYADADALVLASRGETYGMVVTEALAHALPVIATEVGGVPEALGRAPDGTRPGLLVPADDPLALAQALSTWLVDDTARARLRRAARMRRPGLRDWDHATDRVAHALVQSG
jgi:glycosyltransferase involved in cell wall biosynthesis